MPAARHLLPPLALTCLAAFLRFRHLGAASLWMDEAASVALARMSGSDFHHIVLVRELNMVPFYLLLRTVPALTRSEAALRLLPAIFGVLLIPLLWWLATRVLRGEIVRERPRLAAALLATSLAALNAFLIAYSQEGRAYSMALFFLTAALCVTVRILESHGSPLLWTVLALFALYSHFYTVLWLVPQAVFLVRALRKQHRSLAPSAALLLLGILPLVFFALHTRGGQLDWVPHLTPAYLARVFLELAGYSAIATLLLLVTAVAGAIVTYRLDGELGKLLLSQLLFPLALLAVAAIAHPVLVPRFLIFLIPPLLLCAVRPVRLHCLLCAAVIFTAVAAFRHTAQKPDWRRATPELCVASDRSPVLFWPPLAKLPFAYYAPAAPACSVTVVPGTLTPTARDFLYGKRDVAQQACAQTAPTARLVLDLGRPADLADLTGHCYREVSRSPFHGLTLVRLERLPLP